MNGLRWAGVPTPISRGISDGWRGEKEDRQRDRQPLSSNVKLQTEDAVEDDEDVQRIEGEGHPLSVREKIALRRHPQRDDLIVRRLSKNEGDEIESESDKTEGDKHDGGQKSEGRRRRNGEQRCGVADGASLRGRHLGRRSESAPITVQHPWNALGQRRRCLERDRWARCGLSGHDTTRERKEKRKKEKKKKGRKESNNKNKKARGSFIF